MSSFATLADLFIPLLIFLILGALGHVLSDKVKLWRGPRKK